MSSLIHTFPPERGESPIGYQRRLAEKNGYADWHGMVRAAEVNPTLNGLWKSRKELCHALGLDAKWVYALLPTAQEGVGLHDPFFARSAADPICPDCLKESEFIRHAWSHCFVTACPIHHCQLVDHCPNCLSPLESTRHAIAMCDCGYDLRYIVPPPAPVVACWIAARLAGDMRHFEGMEELGAENDYTLLAKLIFQLTVRFDPTTKVRPSKVARPRSVAEAIEFLAPVSKMLENWRPKFAAHVGERFAAGRSDAYSLSGRLGSWYTNLHKLCRLPPAFAVVWQVFSDAAFECFDGVLRGQGVLTPSADKQRRYLSLQEAAKAIGISGPTMQSAIEKKLVTAHISREGEAYRITMVSREEVERVQTLRGAWLSESQAAEQLGVADSVLQNMVRSGVLPSDSDWRLSFYKPGPIPSSALTPLVPRLAGFVQAQEARETLTFNQLTARRTVDVKALIALYQAIFSGEIRPVGHDGEHGLGGFIFSAVDIKRHLGSVALTNGLTLTQLELATGWKYEAISRWTELGVLESELVRLQGRSARIVTIGGFAKFRSEWVPVAELANAVGSKASALTRRFEEKGVQITGQTDSTKGPRRGGLVRIKDLIDLAGLNNRNAAAVI